MSLLLFDGSGVTGGEYIVTETYLGMIKDRMRGKIPVDSVFELL
jgi:hypothetical protein